VDAADLHLVLDPLVKEEVLFHGLLLASKDPDLCTDCGLCREKCRFNAVDESNDIIRESCEGCGVCELVCPERAICMVERVSGTAFLSGTRFGPMAHACLHTAEEGSGKLVTLVRSMAMKAAEAEGRELILIDGPPGIGCPVISAISGVDMMLAVTEPTVSGIHDLERVLAVADHFGVPATVCVNKSDINEELSAQIAAFCASRGLEFLGSIPYDASVTKAMVLGQTIIEYGDTQAADQGDMGQAENGPSSLTEPGGDLLPSHRRLCTVAQVATRTPAPGHGFPSHWNRRESPEGSA